MKRIILLDIDGVLVQPGGYRATLRATVRHFLGEYPIEEDLPASMEKRGISSEWDMAPLIIAAYWDNVLSRQRMDALSHDVRIAARQIQSLRTVTEPKHLSIPAFELVEGIYPADAAYQAGCFKFIPNTLQKNLLTESRSVEKSQTMRVFQHFTLGSKTYSETYQQPSEFETDSLLLLEDKPNISPEIVEKLNHPRHHLAAFTARPSHPPRGIEAQIGYAPEAELALELIGMTNIPLMAFGKLEYIAAKRGLDPAALVKPSPFQALAGILAAWTGDELAALNAAYDWLITGKLNELFNALPRSFELIVVEDTMGGIRSVQAAGGILKQAGFNVNIRAIGLTGGIPAKAEAFTNAGVSWVEDWDKLIKTAFLY